MKKLFSLICLVFIIVSQFQVLQVYAESEAELSAEKQRWEQALDAVGQVIDGTVQKIETKLGNNKEKKERLENKREEIEQYLEEVQEEIGRENRSEDIKQKVEEAKKVVVLKVVSWVIEYEDVEDNIDSEVAGTPAEIEEALETIQESMETKTWDYSIIVRSNKSEWEVSKLFQTFDLNTRIEFMYESGGENYFEVFLDEDSIFRQEMLEDIESGILPEVFLWVEIILPEVFGINTPTQSWILSRPEEKGAISLMWEDISETWGIEKYKSYEYIEDSKTESRKIKVWVVDTGIDYNHPDLKNNVNQKLGKDFVNDDDDAWDDQWHGTHVAGTIAANVNGSWIIGVNPYVELVPLKICTERGFCPSYAVLRALDYAMTQEIDILNMSLWGRGTPDGHPICDGIASVVDTGGIVVAASGNSNIDTIQFVPGGCSDAITVAAVDNSGMRAPFSNYGSKVDVAAPGLQIYSTYPTNKGNYRKLSGTSMATPHIVGLVSLMQAHDEDITAWQVKIALKKYTSSVKTDQSYKTIAAGVNVVKLMESYRANKTTNSVVTEPIKTPTFEAPKIASVVKAKIKNTPVRREVIKQDTKLEGEKVILESLPADASLEWTQAGEYQQEEEEFGDEDEEIIISPDFIPLDLWEENIEINDNEDFEYVVEEEVLTLKEEKLKSYEDIRERQVYDTEWKTLSNKIEINTGDSESTTWESFTWELDIYNLPEKLTTDKALSSSFTDEELEDIELIIDWAKPRIEIHSFEEEDIVFQTWALNGESELRIDQDGNTLELAELELIETVEQLESEYQDAVFIDGAEIHTRTSNDEIEGSQELQLQEYIWEDEGYTEWPVIIWYDTSERQEDIIPNEEESQAIEEILEELVEPEETSQELFIDEAKAWVEISSQQKTLWEEIQVDEYKPEDDIDTVEIPEDAIPVEITIEEIEEATYDSEIFIDGAESWIEISNIEEDKEIREEAITEFDLDDLSEENAIYVWKIDTPQELVDDPDFVWPSELWDGEYERIIIQEASQEEWDSEQDWTIGIQNTYLCELPSIFMHCTIDISRAYEYEFRWADTSKMNFLSGSRELIIKAKEIGGESVYKLYKNGKYYHTIVVVTPKPTVKNVNVILWKDVKIYFPSGSIYTWSKDHFYKDIVSSLYNHNTNYVSISWRALGEMRYHVFKKGILKTAYILNVTVVPPPPTQSSSNMLEGQRVTSTLKDARYHDFSLSKEGYITLQKWSDDVYITGKKAWTLKVYAKRNGVHTHTINVIVEAPPKPKEYSVNVVEWKDVKVYFPDKNNSSYWVDYVNTGRATLYNSSWYIIIRGTTYGDIVYYIKDSDGVIKYIVNVKVIPKPPVVIDVSVYPWQKVSSYMRYASSHSLTVSKPWHVALSSKSSHLYITGNKAWSVKIYAKRDGVHRYTLNVTIKETPKVLTYTATVLEWKETRVYLPSKFSYRFFTLWTPTGSASFYDHGTSGYIRLVWNTPWKVSYIIRDQNNQHRYTVHATITSNPPIVKSLSLYEGRSFSFKEHKFHTPSTSRTWIVKAYFSTRYEERYSIIEGLSPGIVNVYLRDAKGTHRYTYRVTIKPKPKPKTYDISLLSWGSSTLHLPEDISKYAVRWEGDDIFDKHTYSWNQLYFSTRTVGKYTLTFIDKTNNFPKYIVYVEAKAEEKEYSLYVTDEIDVWGHYRYSRTILDSSIVDYDLNGNDSILRGRKAGKTEIKIYKDWGLRKIWKVTVIDIPTPKTIECTTEVWKDCDFRIPNDGYYYHESKLKITEIESSSKSIEVTGKASGTIEVYVRSAVWDYISHILEVTVRANPAKKIDCTTPVWLNCAGVWHEIKDYEYRSSNPDIVEFRKVYEYKKITGSSTHQKTGKEGLQITGKKQGTVDVYVFIRWDHYATIRTTVIAPVPDIQINGGNITLKEWEKWEFQITNGWWDYRVVHTDPDMYSLNINNQQGVTADIIIEGQNVWRGYTIIEDQYRQKQGMKIEIEDTNLILSAHTPHINVYQVDYIAVFESYKGIKSITPSNDHVEAQFIVDEVWTEYIKVVAKKPGDTLVEIRDYEDNIQILDFTVSWSIPLKSDAKNLIKNGVFDWSWLRNTKSIWWLDTKENWWSARLNSNNARAEIKNGRLELEVKDGSYVQARNIVGGHYNVQNESIAVTPNTQYKLSYEYETDHISWDSKHGFNVYVLFQEENKKRAGYHLLPFVNKTQAKTYVEYDFITPDGANYLNIAPLIYGHTGAGTLHMKAWIDNISLVKVENNEQRAKQDIADKGVRYIRDWAYWSNKNKGSHWVELKAFDTNWKNIARGKNVTSNWGTHPTRSISRFTDGNGVSWNYTGTTKQTPTYLQVDLWNTYSIGSVQVLHYFKDGRTYNNTKTEVSADGVNWIALHDSAVFWTYPEPKDGSGKTYKIQTPRKEASSWAIRYIRDWVNGSNLSTSNVWNEIKVFEKWSGKNLAKGIIPTTDITFPTGSLRTLTDEKIQAWYSTSLWVWKSYANALNYMQIDLWNLYDVQSVWVWHFFTDERVFNNTKTEVSPDGINWTTLYDSAVSWTYAEPKDGSGRIYEVVHNSQTSGDSEEFSELEKILEELFAEFGIQNIERKGVEINNHKSSKEIISLFIKKIEVLENKSDIVYSVLKKTSILKNKFIDEKRNDYIDILTYLETEVIKIDSDRFCREYRAWNLINNHYEEICGTVIQSKIVNLDWIKIVTRKEWWAKYNQEDYVPNWKSSTWDSAPVKADIYNNFFRFPWKRFDQILDTIVIHHSAWNQYENMSVFEEKMRSDNYYSIAYHFIIDWTWKIFEWRPLEFNWDHVIGANTWKIGIVLLWDFEYRWQNWWNADIPTQTQINSMNILTKSLVNRFNIPIDNIWWHKDHKNTDCPGDTLEEKLEYLKSYSEGSIQSDASLNCVVNSLSNSIYNIKK